MIVSRVRGISQLCTNTRRLSSLRSYKMCSEQKHEQFEDPVNQWVKDGKRYLVGGWLLLCAGGVYFMVLLGGYTRLTHSGLSMTKWKPIEYKYPRTEEDWEKEFDHYKQFPEYQHTPIEVDKFKRIYKVEYFHRVSGSTLGAVFLAPLIAFRALNWIKPPFTKRLYIIGSLGGLQGLIGWWMVKSGMDPKPEYQIKPRVSTYRLCTHLSMAVSLYSLLIWNAATLLKGPQHAILNQANYGSSMKMRGLSIGLIHFVAINIFTGATMAGIDAGKVYNTWPLMNGNVVPDIAKLSPFWKNFFENNAMVQFNHRNAAYLTYGFASYLTYFAYRSNIPRQSKLLMYALFGVVNYQLLTGILALLNQVQIHSGCVHQFNALNVLTLSLLLCHSLRRPSSAYQKYLKSLV